MSIISAVDASDVPWFTSDSNSWQRVPYEAVAPTGGVTLDENGLFKPVMERNVAYMMADWRSNVDDMLFWPRRVAKVANPPGKIVSWFEGMFPAHAASFLLGAGNSQSEITTFFTCFPVIEPEGQKQ